MTPAAVALLALVVQDHVALRASAHDAAPKQATLWEGDVLEVRGERQGYVQVFDPRHERPGYVRGSQIRAFAVEAASAPALRSVAAFLRDWPGAESLGIAYVAAAMKVGAQSADDFDTLGVLAERLGRRASATSAVPGDELAAHLEVAASYGVVFQSIEDGGKSRLCYDGDAFRRVLAAGGTSEQRARAALGLTRPECRDPAPSPLARLAAEEAAAAILEQVDPGAARPDQGNALRLRKAALLAGLAFDLTRAGRDGASVAARAVAALAGVDRPELADGEVASYAEAVARVAASRWAAEPAEPRTAGPWTLSTRPGPSTGESCVVLSAAHGSAFERCTYGHPWLASARFDPAGDALALNVQALPAWSELWVLRNERGAWTAQVLPPAAAETEVGDAEAAGWSPDGRHLLVARAARAEGKVTTTFEQLDARTLAVEKRAPRADDLSGFRRWSAPTWKASPLR